MPVTMHDGSRIVLRKVDPDYDPTSRGVALERIQQRMREGEHLTGSSTSALTSPTCMRSMTRPMWP